MNKKYFHQWGEIKTSINNDKERVAFFSERDIWIANLGENIGYEEDGKGDTYSRPILIIRTYGKNMCFVVPLSTTGKRGYFYHEFDGHTGKMSVVLLSQARVIDGLRLRRKIGYASENDFKAIKKRLRNILGI
ncbi:MAG: type II toxin-antitoxin system PemK/MazF family toxin [Clostridiales Family XIII bacterium]|jgi:mRNA interferase MazF|nr:type II toxin-antitoxin system PemK/MazF family toxin [Clostridiales Family XIII bacterium]